MDRQQVLADPNRRFLFLMTEQAVRWRRASSQAMIAQMAHMITAAQRPNVELAVIPLSATVLAAPLNGFVVYDDRLVSVELISGEVALRDPRDIAYHLNLFDYFMGHALTDSSVTALLEALAEEFMRLRD